MRSKNLMHRGFTLVELMVVVTIIILLSGISIAAYYNFSQRQAALNDARSFATTLRRVQAMAKNLVYPVNDVGLKCNGLQKYNLKSDASGVSCEECQTVSSWAVCDNGNFKVIDNEQVLTKAFFSEDISVDFEVGSGKINSPFEVFPLSNTSEAYIIEVKADANGVISAREYENPDY